MSFPIVTLNNDTLQRIDAIALYRQEHKHGKAYINQRDLQIEISGLRGELAVAQYYGVSPNLGLEPDEGWDFIINDKKVDVKYTTYIKGDLIFSSLAHFKADIAILTVELSPTEVVLKGWIERERFLREHLYHASQDQMTTWTGVGMTAPDSSLKKCLKCSYHYAPINFIDK